MAKRTDDADSANQSLSDLRRELSLRFPGCIIYPLSETEVRIVGVVPIDAKPRRRASRAFKNSKP
jgi:hypothetical protein